MYKRIFDIENQLDEAMFLFGARQVGKSTLLQERFPEAIYYDLLIDPQLLKAFPDVKTFLEQEVLPMSKEEVQEGLAKVLGACRKGRKGWTDNFSPSNQIFLDMDRNYTFTFCVDGVPLEMEEPQRGLGNGENPFEN